MTKIAKTLKIINPFNTTVPITHNGKIIEPGSRICPGEEMLLELFSKPVLDELIEKGFLGEVGGDGFTTGKDSAGITYSRSFLEGLITPGAISRAAKLLVERRFDVDDLRILKDKTEEVIESGIENPTLKLLRAEIINQLYGREILNE